MIGTICDAMFENAREALGVAIAVVAEAYD